MSSSFEFDVCVVGGLGHIGLPLSISFAHEGMKVLIHDINESGAKLIQQGVMPFKEDGAEDKLKALINKKLFATTDPHQIKKAQFVIITIGTPVDEHLNPTYHQVKKFFQDLVPYLSEKQIVVLRSTIFPRTTQKVRRLLQKTLPGIEVCFCPERIAEGKAMEELYSLPQIVSGFSDKCLDQVAGLFRRLTSDIIVLEPLEAELTKLFANSWRYLEFAAANQFYMIAQQCGTDFYKIYHAMTYKYPRAKNFPKPGFAAGPCLFKDTMQISAFAQNTFFLGHSAMLINEGLPNYVVEQVKAKYPLANMTAGVLGMAFKAESDDKRESLSYKLRKVLEIESKEVFCSDEYIKESSFVSALELIERCDIIFVGAPHKAYRNLHTQDKIVIDVWNHIIRTN